MKMNTRNILTLLFLVFARQFSLGQTQRYTPKIEPCACAFKADSSHKERCAYLIVPENRNKPNGKTIKLPFIIVESNNPNKHNDPVLYTAGGPGASSLHGVTFVHNRQFLKDRDYIAFEQRGTGFAIPTLSCDGMAEAVKAAYRKDLPLDSMVVEAAKKCRKELLATGVDLDAYNTIENAADIEDLRRALNIDSINLVGISYSGGLMMTVMRNFPQHIRSVTLDSPLPGFVNYEEDALFNIKIAFERIFSNCDRDSTDKTLYGHIKGRFQQYFTSIGNKVFTLKYLENGTKDSITIKYRRSELLDFLVNELSSNRELKHVPYVINQVIAGKQQQYMTAYFDDIFGAGNTNTLGMRFSMYCSEQIDYADQALIDKQNEIFPYLAGYRFNNVSHPICDCWKVKPVDKIAKTPVYSNIPTLLSTADTDPYCPFYVDIINHYMPNSQRLRFVDKTHGPLLNTRYGDELLAKFLANPMEKIVANGKDAVAY
jgi:pimeloyl-ACP methyl ester carboxylesterase